MPNRSQTPGRSGRGFASMDAERQRAIASAGGRAAHRSGNAHEFDAAEAREAGRRGGLARSASRNAARSVELADGQGVMQLSDAKTAASSARTDETH
jgi:general stress protein YciG